MHPRQANLLTATNDLLEKTAAKKPVAVGGSPMLWRYTDPDGKEFFLSERMRTIHSPFTGKSFPAKPERTPPSSVGKELRDEAKDPASAPGPKTGAPKKKRASDDWKA